MSIYIETERLILREFTVHDVEGLHNLKLDYLIAIVELDNIPSQRVVEKCGFTKLDTKMILNSGDTEEKPFYYYRIYNKIH